MLRARVGTTTVHVLSDGTFRLDGGAMFGVVPKVLWQERLPADEENRVTLGLNCLLITTHDDRHVLCDTGMGDRWDATQASRLGLDRTTSLATELAKLGIGRDDVDVVVCSHLHFDHAGGNVILDEDGNLVPAFPSARYVVQDVEWSEAQRPHERHRASYRPDDFLPLERAGVVDLVDGSAEVAPGVRVDLVPGHCPGMQVAWLESEGEVLVFPADVLPTTAHLRPAWNMGFDLDVRATVDAKKELIERAVAEEWLVCLDHEPATPLVRLESDERGRVHARPAGEEVST